MLYGSRIAALLTPGMFALCGCFLIGCGGDGDLGRVSGKVTFKGAPVPAGQVYILPDGSKGNSGPTGYAPISNGTYDTASPGGKGAVKGHVIIAVEGLDPNPPPGASADVTTTVLFPRYEVPAELGESDTTKDIDVPKSAASGPPPSEAAPSGVVP